LLSTGVSVVTAKHSNNIKKYPIIDIGLCSLCKGCVEVAPTVFRFNPAVGIMEVIELASYPEDQVDEAIKNCPEDCIFWQLTNNS
jgi:ferredoxin